MSRRILELYLNAIKLHLEPFTNDKLANPPVPNLTMSSSALGVPPAQIKMAPLAMPYQIMPYTMAKGTISIPTPRGTNQLCQVVRKPDLSFKVDTDSTALDALIAAFNNAVEKLSLTSTTDTICTQEIKTIVTTLNPHVATKAKTSWFGDPSYTDLQEKINKIITAGNTRLDDINEVAALEKTAQDEKQSAELAKQAKEKLEKEKKVAEEEAQRAMREKVEMEAARRAAESKQKELEEATQIAEVRQKRAEAALANQESKLERMLLMMEATQQEQRAEKEQREKEKAERERKEKEREEKEQKRLAHKAARKIEKEEAKRKLDQKIADLEKALKESQSSKALSVEENEALIAKNKALEQDLAEARSDRLNASVLDQTVDQSLLNASFAGRPSSSAANRSVVQNGSQAQLLSRVANTTNGGILHADPQLELLAKEEKFIADFIGTNHKNIIKQLSVLMHIDETIFADKVSVIIKDMLINYRQTVTATQFAELPALIERITEEPKKLKAQELLKQINAAVAADTQNLEGHTKFIKLAEDAIEEKLNKDSKQRALYSPATVIIGELKHLAKGDNQKVKSNILLGHVPGLVDALQVRHELLLAEHQAQFKKKAEATATAVSKP